MGRRGRKRRRREGVDEKGEGEGGRVFLFVLIRKGKRES